MKLSCWIIYNGFLPGTKFLDFAQMIYEAAQAKGHEAYIYKNSDILSMMDKTLSLQDMNGKALPDYVVFTDKDIYLAKQFELLGLPVFNSAQTIEISDDKIKTYQALAANQIAIPKTIFAPKTFGMDMRLQSAYIKKISKILSYPLIIKEAFGSFGEQVYLIENERLLLQKVAEIGNKPFMFQQFIDTSYGVDLRLQVVGDEVVAAMRRTAENDFRANVTSGGRMAVYQPSEQEKEIAVRASRAIGADFSGVDLLFGKNNKPVVCEVNSNAHIRNLLDCTGINCADPLITYITKKMGGK